jgi:hypothetical protein
LVRVNHHGHHSARWRVAVRHALADRVRWLPINTRFIPES